MGEKGINDLDAQIISAILTTNNTLTDLRLTRNKICDDGAIQIGKALGTNNTLTVVGLYKNKIGDDGAIAIGKALEGNSTIKQIYMAGNKISKDVISIFIGNGFKCSGFYKGGNYTRG